MRDTSETYNTLRKLDNAVYDVQVIQGDHIYGMDVLKQCEITQSAFNSEGPQIGCASAASCTLILLEKSANWPRMAEFTVRVRLRDESEAEDEEEFEEDEEESIDEEDETTDETVSEWLNLGIFYTDERSSDYYGELTVIGYDKMLMFEQPWVDAATDAGASWPMTADEAAGYIAELADVDIDPRTQLDDSLAFIAKYDTRTARDTLADIAAVHGGNWIITPEGKLRLIPLVSSYESAGAIAGIAIAGIAVVGVAGGGNNASPPSRARARRKILSSNSTEDETPTINLGLRVMSLETDEPLEEITGVELEDQNGNVSSAGSSSGYILKANCEFADADAADICIDKVSGIQYRSFSARYADLDPAAEIGDCVILNGVCYQIITAKWTLGRWIYCDISAPGESSVDHEYTMQTDGTKALRSKVSKSEVIQSVNESTEDAKIAAGKMGLSGQMNVYTDSTLNTSGGYIGYAIGSPNIYKDADTNIGYGIILLSANHDNICLVNNDCVFLGHHEESDEPAHDGSGGIDVSGLVFKRNIIIDMNGIHLHGEVDSESITNRTTSLESAITNLTNSVSALTDRISALESELSDLEERVLELEGEQPIPDE